MRHCGKSSKPGSSYPTTMSLVVTATTRPRAQAVVTSNADDFRGETLSPLELEAPTQMTFCPTNY
jgi:hypothetical protein